MYTAAIAMLSNAYWHLDSGNSVEVRNVPCYPELSRLNNYFILTESSVSALRCTPQPGLYLQDHTSYFIVG